MANTHSRQLSTISVVLTFLLAAAVPGAASEPASTVPLLDHLGTHRYTITTRVPLAQRYFDQGLRLYYAFNHAEAIRAFEEASRLDPDCAMCYWGIALAHGPNINAPMERPAALAAYDAIQKAVARQAAAGPAEDLEAWGARRVARFSHRRLETRRGAHGHGHQ